MKKDTAERTRYLELNEDLKSGQYRPIYLLYGEEAYLKRAYKRRFKEAIGGTDGMNCQVFSGAVDVDVLIDALETMPFFAEHRLVVLEDAGYFKKAAPERLLTYLPGMPETSCLMLVEGEVDKRSRLYKLCVKQGFACELSEQDERTLSAWAARYLMKAGKRIRASTMQGLLRKTGSSMDRIVGELEKLIAYTGEREAVEDADVEMVCTQNAEDRVFDMIAALSLGQRERAMRYYADLSALQEPPMKLLALMRRHYRQLLLMKEAEGQPSQGRKELAQYVGAAPWAVPKLQEQARRYRIEELEACLSRCLSYDAAIKQGGLSDRMAMELLLTMQ